MFEDSLFATNARPARQRGLAAVLSFGAQAVCLCVLVLVPLIYSDALPLNTLKNYVQIPVPPGRPTPPTQPPRHQPRPPATNVQNARMIAPNRIPDHVSTLPDDPAPSPAGPYVPGSPEGVGNDPRIANLLLANNMRPAPPEPPPAIKRTIKLSHLDEGLLVHRVTPAYPYLAKMGRIQGPVVLQAFISRDGTIKNLQAVSGNPILVPAALDAVKQWRYRPYLLNNEPVEVETQITVNFNLGG